jgi:hypothetical protein
MSSPESDTRYMIIDENGTQFTLNHGSLQILDDSFPVETDVIERSFTDGAIAPGESRATGKELSFKVDINEPTEQAYRAVVNNLFYWIRKAVILRDTINNIETDVRVLEKSITYDTGGFLHGSVVNWTFQQLIPFWRDVAWQEESENVSLSNVLVLENDGYYDTPAIFILNTDQEIPRFLVKELNTNLGIGIADLNFGKVNLETYVIDNENGEALLGSGETGGVLRNDRILSGTGFFFLRRGTNNLQVFTWQDRDVDFTVRWKRRYFV